KSAAREERDRESERFFSDDDSDEELRERVDSTGRPLNRGLNIRPLGQVDQDTNEGNSKPVAVRPLEVERPSFIGANLRINQQSVQAGQEALIETIRTTVPPRFEANPGGSAAENSNLSQNQANLGGTQQNQQSSASNQAVAPSALPTVQTSLTGVAGSQISQNLPSGQVAQPVVFAAPAVQQFQFPAAAGQPFGLGASAAQPEDVPQLS
uniref:LsmAD domain-containing protein n=2 Tax=Bursaphelenchus xylophilus TaxID=6326 RepID=A0A1I7SMY4_BURXY